MTEITTSKEVSKADILQETLEFYSQDPTRRAAKDKDCHYLMDDGTGRRCAVGRCLSGSAKTDDDISKYYAGCKGLAAKYGGGSIDNLLAPQYRGFSIDFWVNLQDLHDIQENWTDTGLSERGLSAVKRICFRAGIDFKELDFSSISVPDGTVTKSDNNL